MGLNLNLITTAWSSQRGAKNKEESEEKDQEALRGREGRYVNHHLDFKMILFSGFRME